LRQRAAAEFVETAPGGGKTELFVTPGTKFSFNPGETGE
jgi:hypothetical protein